MTDDKLKLTLSIIGAFAVTATDVYFNIPLPERNALSLGVVVAMIMSGVKGVGIYLVGYVQKNPRNEAKSAEEVLAVVKRSDLPAEVKAQVSPALATETARPTPGAPPPVVLVPPATAWSSAEPPEVQAAARARAEALALPPDQGRDGLLFLDCLAVSRFAVAGSLAAFHALPEAERAAWRLYITEVLRREKESQ